MKGYCAVQLATVIGNYMPGTQQFVNFKLTLGVAALLGHIFPVLAGFRGGKGVATLLGILSGVHPPAALVCAGVFVVTLLVTKYVSLSSMLAAIAFPIIIMFVYHETIRSLNVFSMFVAVMVLITHQKNIERLLNGEERKVKLLNN
jgi:glycerol-3-phosphate acyltransferase PlsY